MVNTSHCFTAIVFPVSIEGGRDKVTHYGEDQPSSINPEELVKKHRLLPKTKII